MDVRQENMAKHGRSSLQAHIDEYVKFKRDRGLKKVSLADISRRLKWLVEATGARCLDDLTPENIGGALGQLKDSGLSHCTVNHRLSATRTFLN